MRVADQTMRRLAISQFCEESGISVVVRERPHVPEGSLGRFYAKLDGVECIDTPGILTSTFANGRTKDEAISGLASEYSNRRLVVGAHTDSRREFGPFVFVQESPQWPASASSVRDA